MTATARPSSHGDTLADRTTLELQNLLAQGWTNLNGVDIEAELAWREAQVHTDEALFEAIEELEFSARGFQASAELGVDAGQRWNARRRLAATKASLYRALEALTAGQLAAYGAWRAAR